MMQAKGSIQTCRVYDPPEGGYRVLVDRLWPRGVSKEAARLNEWSRELAPSAELRKWFGHLPERWEGFERKYREELKGQAEALRRLGELAQRERLVLVYAAKDESRNNAVVIRAVLEEMARRTG